MKYLLLQPVLLLLLCTAMYGQSAKNRAVNHSAGEMIVQLMPGVNPDDFLAKLNRTTGDDAGWRLKKTIVGEWRIYLLGFDTSYSDPERLLDAAFRLPEVQSAQWNHQAEERGVVIPNDPDWFQQADMSLIHAPEAWSSSTGGLTPNGDTIVVAVLEIGGALLTHPDLAPNRWWNWNEKPNDGLDNDQNGFIDDFGGWNAQTHQDDTAINGWHGTGVYGIIGAAGDNNRGVSGVNWRVKMLNVAGTEDDVTIIEGYYYVYVMRRLYNETNGAKGAFVVATNASFGIEYVFPTTSGNLGIWCSLYDSLGRVGVLNVGATTNKNTNVEEEGDMPTTCGSEFLITVTEINVTGGREESGYGNVSIDLGAPGRGTYTTANIGNDTPGYNSVLGGTSAATPHVSGAVALLYSLGCAGFTGDALTDPPAAVRRVRDAILDNTKPNPVLDSITVTGGQLDLERAIQGVTEACNATTGVLDILQVRTVTSGNEVQLFYQTPIFLPYRFRVFNMLGQQIYAEELYPKQFYENYVKFDFSDLPQGVYVLSISRGNAIVSVKFPKI